MNSSKKKLKARYCCECSNVIYIYAFGSCFHPICFRCSTKLRVLRGDLNCPICSNNLARVIFTTALSPEHQQDVSSFVKDQKHGIWAESSQIRNQYSHVEHRTAQCCKQLANFRNFYRALLQHRCPALPCRKTYSDILELKKHLEKEHVKTFCHICLNSEKVFTDEREVFSIDRPDYEHEGVRYSTTDEYWEHCVEHHYTCEYSGCQGKPSSYFTSEQELNNHTKFAHGYVTGTGSTSLKSSVRNKANATETSSIKSTIKHNGDDSESNDTIKGKGQIVVLHQPFGFIQRDDAKGDALKNVYFNRQACGVSFTQDTLTSLFDVGDRVFFHAVPHESGNSNWKATYVVRLDEAAASETLNHSSKLSPSNKERKIKEETCALVQTNIDKEHKGLEGVVHPNLGPIFGFIIPKKNIGKRDKNDENVYFNLSSYSAANNKKIADLTTELKHYEAVYYELAPNFNSKKYRAAKVWKQNLNFFYPVIRTEKYGTNLASVEIPPPPTQALEQVKAKAFPENNNEKVVNSNSTHAKTNSSNQVTKPSSPVSQKAVNYNLPSCSSVGKSMPITFGNGDLKSLEEFYQNFNINGNSQEWKTDSDSETIDDELVDLSVANEMDIFRNILKELLHEKMDESLFELEMELATNHFSLSQVSCIQFSRNKCPTVYPTWTSQYSNQVRATLLSIVGFDEKALNRMVDKAMILQDDDIYYVEDTNLYLLVFKDKNGLVQDISLHTNFKSF